MKISRDAKETIKMTILETSIQLMTEKGFKNTSMREIAEKSGISNPTIYNYFPTKEHLVYAYIELKHKQTNEILSEINDFHTYTLREQLQVLVETELELYLENREFFVQIAEMVFDSSSLKIDSLYATNKLFTDITREILDISIEAEEIALPPFFEYLPKLFWDYFVIVVAYWVKDDSEDFENTTQFIDHSMGVIEALLHSNLLNKAADLGMFLFKKHLLSSLSHFAIKQNHFSKTKRKLGELFHG